MEAPSPSVITGLATLSYKLPSCNIIAASPRTVLKELIQWSGLGAEVGGGHSQFTQRVVGVLDYAKTVIIRAAD